VAGYSGDAGDAMAAPAVPRWTSNGQMFSTPDSDNDAWTGGSCAASHVNGWWFGECSSSHLNKAVSEGIWWAEAEPSAYDIQASHMLVKFN